MARFLAWVLFGSVVSVQGQVQITEFMASNTQTLRDDFGQYEDWIEIFNSSSAAVNLRGWALTDNPDNLSKWQFPDTNLPPKSFLVVFASSRDRATPGLPLHTDFKLAAEGEYLALVHPDGSMASEFSPDTPQMPDVSFGLGRRGDGDLLLKGGATGRLLVPVDGTLGGTWVAPDFDDSLWRVATNGIGFETGETDDPVTVVSGILADEPLGYWRLSESSGSTTANAGSLARSADGQLLDGAVFGVAGPRPPEFPGFEAGNLAVRCNGSGARVEVPYGAGLNPDGSFTVEAWVKPARAGGPPAWVVSSLDVDGGRNGYALAQDYSAKNEWEFRLGDGNGYIATPHGGIVDPARWQYLAGVFDGTTAKLYVDGALAASATLARPFNPNTREKMLIGGRVNVPNPYYYAGDVDEVTVIAGALSAAGIAMRYQMATNPAPAYGSFHYSELIRTDLRADMLGVNSSAYLRIPFVVTNVAETGRLMLRLRYEDGFAAWLNGVPVSAANAPASLGWNSAALTQRYAAEAVKSAEFDLSPHLASLRTGTNVLAVQALNVAVTNTDLLLLAELEASSSGDFQTFGRYFTVPTPGEMNGSGLADLGPVITRSGHAPYLPGTNDSITVTCRVTQAFAPVKGVTLHWRVMFDPIQPLPMFDDGLHGDGLAGDGVYAATIPNRAGAAWTYSAGQMVRWFITAADSLSRTSRWPLFDNPQETAEYQGTVVQADYVVSQLPVFHLFAPPTVLQPGPNTQQIGADSETGGRVALYYDGELYDNIYMELRGNTSAGLNKKAHRLEFNREHPFRHPGATNRIRKSSLLAEHLDPSFVRQHLCFWLLDAMGVPAPFDYPIRAQLNGSFYQLAFHNDVLGEEQLERLGYATEGALYKAVGQVNPQFSSTGGFQKLLPKTNLVSRADYLALANGINESRTLAERRAAVFDLFDVAQVVNYLAGARFCAENDDVWANMCLYRDTHGDGLWRIIPFDMNASWGQLYGGSSPLEAINDYSKSHPFYGGSQVQENGSSPWNRVYDVIIALPETRDMLRRRQRTLLDALVLPPGTAAELLPIESYIKQLTNQIHAEAILDRQKWGYSPWAYGQSFQRGVGDLLTQFLPPRRRHWYGTHCVTNTAKPLGLGNSFNAGLPLSQPATAVISIVGWDLNPGSGNQDEEYLCLTNRNDYPVDISGWTLEGGVRHRFVPGTVIPPAGALYLSPNVQVFRERATSPRGGMGLFVQGNYQGHLNAWGENLTISDASGRVVSNVSIPGAPSLAQRFLRIVEIQYNPTTFGGATNDPQSFEYLKLKNISLNQVLDLRGVRLVKGVSFDFSGSAVNYLQPGQSIYVVRDTNAFALRFGEALVAGQFTGALNNGGEELRLDDATGEKILEFDYENDWYPVTDGQGGSLVIANENASWESWGRKTSWRAAVPSVVIEGVAIEGSRISFSFQSSVGSTYSLEYTEHLSAAQWMRVPGSEPGTGGWLTLRDNVLPETNRFYRVRME